MIMIIFKKNNNNIYDGGGDDYHLNVNLARNKLGLCLRQGDNRLLYFIIFYYIKKKFDLSTDKLGLFLRQRAKEQGGLQLGTYHYLTAGDHNHHQTHT